MDLRGFGTQRRTWLRELSLDRTDRAVLAFFGGLLVGITVLGFSGYTELWVPALLADLA
jgi:energy-coupling factor transport system permease protein